MHVPGLARVRQANRAALHGVFNIAHDQLSTQLRCTKVAKIRDLGKIMAGVDHQQGVRNAIDPKRFLGAFQQHQRVFAA